jgi:hypothetical protein
MGLGSIGLAFDSFTISMGDGSGVGSGDVSVPEKALVTVPALVPVQSVSLLLLSFTFMFCLQFWANYTLLPKFFL